MLAWPALPSFVPSPTPAIAACKSTFMSCRSPAPVARLQGPTFGKAPATTSGGSSSSSSAAPRSLVRTLLTLALVVSSMLPPATMMAAPEPPAMVALAPQRRGEPPTALPTTMSLAAADEPAAIKPPSQKYLLFTGFPFPLGPFTERKTVESELVKGRVYSFEQEIRLSGISANVRCTVFRMRDNHLLVYNPVAPTDEFLAQLKALDSKGVAHILLGATPYEHKVFVGPFARRFPEAKVWAVPDQWSFPVDLPAPLLGIDTKGTGGGDLTDTAAGSAAYANAPDLTDEFEVKLLRPSRRLGLGYAANEAAVLHKDTKTLALTDALIYVPGAPTKIYDEGNLRAIGDNARDSNSLGNLILKGAGAVNWRGTAAQTVGELWADGIPQGTDAEVVQRGWERNVLLSLFFGPSPDALVTPTPSFEGLKGRWIVAPVTDALIYRSERVKPELSRWVNDIVTNWDFTVIVPSHFEAHEGTPEDMRAAFKPTLAATTLDEARRSTDRPYKAGDVQLLDDIAGGLIQLKVI